MPPKTIETDLIENVSMWALFQKPLELGKKSKNKTALESLWLWISYYLGICFVDPFDPYVWGNREMTMIQF